MKKRLSLLLAALMIFTMLPMSAFAAAVPSLTVLSLDANDTTEVSVTVNFRMPAGIPVKEGQVRFELTNDAEFAAAPTFTFAGQKTTGGADGTNNVAKPLDNVAFLNVTKEYVTDATTDVITVTFDAKIKFPSAGDVFLKVIDDKNVGFVSQDVKIAVVRDSFSGLNVTASDSEKAISFDGGKLSQFEVKNISFPANATHLVLELNDEEYSFATTTTQFANGAAVNDVLTKKDALVIAKTDVDGKNLIVVPVLEAMGRKATEGNVNVTVRYAKVEDANGNDEKFTYLGSSASATIGKVVDYNVTMKIVEKGKKEIPSVWGGEKATIVVTLKGPKGSFSKRAIDLTLDGATFAQAPADQNGLTFGKLNKDENEVSITGGVTDETTEVKFEAEIATSAHKDGVAVLTANQRGWEAKADAAKIMPKFKVEAAVTPVKKGEAKETEKVVITEAKAGLLEKNDKLQISFNTRRDYTQFTTKDIKIEATNGMKFGDPSFVAIKAASSDVDPMSKFVTIEVPVTKQSAGEPAVITISGVKVLVDGSSTDDVIKVDGRLNGARVSSADYVKVVKEYALESIKTVFTIGQTAYTVNGEAKAAASAPYVKNGRTMLPIRAVAESLGLTVQWNGATKTASFTDDTKVAAVVIGAEVMYVNGTPIPLSAKAELVNGTTFVELRSLATAFGVQIDWDAATKQAIVSK